MKVCLIFSPFASFSYVPLGISYLKSFIEKNIPSVRVKNFDLSNDFYHNLYKKDFRNSLLNLCQICPKNSKLKCKGILRNKEFTFLLKVGLVAQACFTDPKTNEFYDIYKYNKLKEALNLLYSQITSCLIEILRHSLEFNRKGDNIILEKNLFNDDINKICSENPDIVGFSVFSVSQLYYSLMLAKIIKKRINPKIIFGGACISHMDYKTILQIFDFIDFIIYKEGELAISSLLGNFKERRFDQVPNLVYRKSGRITKNKEEAVHNIDEIPFPNFSDYRLDRYFSPRPVLSTLFSRGCFWGACRFCALSKVYSKPHRVRSISNLIQELNGYQQMGIEHIWFADESISAANLDLISKILLKEKIRMYYGIMARPTGDFTYKILRRMYRAGFRNIGWGVESTSQRILNLMNKGTHIEEIKNVLRTSAKVGLSNSIYMIIGFPMQTENEILKDFQFLRKELRYIYDYFIHPFWLEEETAIFRNPAKFELKDLKRVRLLKTKRGVLFSPDISFGGKVKIDRKRMNKLASKNLKDIKWLNKFNDANWLFYPREHSLLHSSQECPRLELKKPSLPL